MKAEPQMASVLSYIGYNFTEDAEGSLISI